MRQFSALCAGKRGWAAGLCDAEANSRGEQGRSVASEPVRRTCLARVGRQAQVASPPVSLLFFLINTSEPLFMARRSTGGCPGRWMDGRTEMC